MKKWILFFVSVLVFSVVLTACGGETVPVAVEVVSGSSSLSEEMNPTAVIAAVTGNSVTLSTEYRNALPVEAQLAFGTVQLEETNLAVTAEQAEAILPYWRVLQSLTQTGNAADAEINAVIKQIQDGMTGEQIASIAAMELTEEKLQTMLEEGTIAFGRGFGQGADGGTAGGGGIPGGGLRGGGLPGGGPGGGGPGGFGRNQGDLATRQAELEASGENPMTAFIERASSSLVIRLLETKTGEAPPGGFGGVGAAYAAVTDLTGLSEEELGEALAEGQTLGEIVEAHGVPVAEAREAMIDAMADVQLREGQDLESWIDGLLAGEFGARSAGGAQ